MNRKRTKVSARIALGAAVLVVAGLGLRAQDAAQAAATAPAAQAKPYFSSTSFSLLFTRGNNQNLSYSVDTDQNLALGKNALNFKGSAIYSRSNHQPRSGIYYAHLKYDRQLSARAYLLGLTRVERNTSAGYMSRVSVTTGGGYTWIKKDNKVDVSSEVSLGWGGENNVVPSPQAGSEATTRKTDFLSSIMSHKLIYNVSETAQITIQGVVFSNLKDLRGFRVNSYSSLSAAISPSLALKTSLQVTYDNQPVVGYKPTDIYFLSSFVVKI
jgi:putative salt-induced outer membrane protein YdiY